MNVKAVDFVVYTVTDIAASVPFYRDTLGLELEWLGEEEGGAEFALPPTTLALVEATRMPLTPGEGGTGVAIAVDDVKTATEELQNQEVAVLVEPFETDVCHMSMIADPDNNPILFHKRKDGTHGRVDPFP